MLTTVQVSDLPTGIWFPDYEDLPPCYLGTPSQIVLEIVHDFGHTDITLDAAVDFLMADLEVLLGAQFEFPRSLDVKTKAALIVALMLKKGIALPMARA